MDFEFKKQMILARILLPIAIYERGGFLTNQVMRTEGDAIEAVKERTMHHDYQRFIILGHNEDYLPDEFWWKLLQTGKLPYEMLMDLTKCTRCGNLTAKKDNDGIPICGRCIRVAQKAARGGE